jgi:hypothetical protein
MKCAGDSAGHCYLVGWYQGTNTFGTYVLQPQGVWNFFLANLSSTVLGPPGPITLLSPVGSLAFASTNLYTWEADTNATWYELSVTLNGRLFVDKWYALGDLMVVNGTNLAVNVSGHTSGSYQWYVRGYDPGGLGPWSGPMNFSLGIPGAVALLAPANNASLANRQPDFIWSQSVPPATWFRLYVARNQTTYLDQWIEGATNWMPTTDLPAGSYSWWVETYNATGLGPWSTNATFTIPLAVLGALALVSPTGGSVPSSLKQLYTWQADAAATWYELYVVQNGQKLCDSWFTLSNSVAQSGSGDFAVEIWGHTGTNYQWWVRGWGADGLGPWSGPGSYTMPAVPPPGPVTLLTPANNANVLVRQPEFTWTASSPAASWYYVYVVRNGSKDLDQWVAGTTNWVPPAGLAGGNYSWWVLPWSEAGYGSWSANSTFTIQTAMPGALTLVSPAGSVAAGSTQRYTWKADAAAIWYELYATRNGGVFCDKWYTLTNSVVDSATGNFAVDVSGHTGGSYQWWVRGWSPDGLGPWSSNLTFQVP